MAEWMPIETAPNGKPVLVYKSNTQEQYVAAYIHGAYGPGWCAEANGKKESEPEERTQNEKEKEA